MNAMLRTILLATLVAVPLLVAAPTTAQGQDYWGNYWGWYDNVYRPYYQRSYYYGPGYSNYYGPSSSYYGGGYYSPYGYASPYGYGYGYTPYRSYYSTGDIGYGRMRGGGQAVNVGPLTFGWR
jgi:hypothetical protein